MPKRKRRQLTDPIVRVTINGVTFDRNPTRAERDASYQPVKRVERVEPMAIDMAELERLVRVELAKDADSIPDTLAERLLTYSPDKLAAFFDNTKLSTQARRTLLARMVKLTE